MRSLAHDPQRYSNPGLCHTRHVSKVDVATQRLLFMLTDFALGRHLS